jgi:hypothetical protein
MQLYPEDIAGPVADMEFSELPGISEYGLILAIPGSGGGLGYFDDTGQFNIYSPALNIGAVSVAPDNANNRIFCAFGCGSYSDGLWEFDVDSLQFELIEYAYNPNFVKKLSSGYYFGWGNGLLSSTDGNTWTDVDYFNGKVVRDIEETSDGTLFVAANNEIYIGSDTSFSCYDTLLPVIDIYVRPYPTEEVFIALGEDACESNGIYRVEYEDGEITGTTLINYFFYPNKIYEYEDWLVVGNLTFVGAELFLLEPVEMGEVYQIGAGLDIEDVFCFETYPIYCPNIMVGTDNGIYLGTGLEPYGIDDWHTPSSDVVLYQNSPNPFSTSTTISFNLHHGDTKNALLNSKHLTGQAEIKIYNIKGQLVKQFRIKSASWRIKITNEVVWDGTDQNGKELASGIYFYRLVADNYKSEIKKMILIK